jgi:hypothetical protein
MQPIGPDINTLEGGLNNCQPRAPLPQSQNIDPPPSCPVDPNNQNNVPDTFESWESIKTADQNIGLGTDRNCDPIQTGAIVNDLRPPTDNTIYRYSKTIRATDEACMDLFRKLVVIDEDGVAHQVPIIWGTQDRAVAFVAQQNTKTGDTLVVNRLRLPLLAISQTGIEYAKDKYIYHGNVDWRFRKGGKNIVQDTIFGTTWGIPLNVTYNLLAWTLHLEDMNQITEQVITKFSPVAYIKVRGVNWEPIVTLESITNNLDFEPGDAKLRVIKFQYTIKALTWLQQPLLKRKTVLNIPIEFTNSGLSETSTEIIGRQDVGVKK